MNTLKNILNRKNIIATGSFFSAAILSLTVISPAMTGIKKGMELHTNCVNTVFPDDVERDIVVDADAGLIYVGYYKNGRKKETTLNLNNNSTQCTDGVRELVTLAKKYSDKIDADTCKEFIQIISSTEPLPVLGGKQINLKAANKYIIKHCK